MRAQDIMHPEDAKAIQLIKSVPGCERYMDRRYRFAVPYDGLQRFLALLPDHGQSVQVLGYEALERRAGNDPRK